MEELHKKFDMKQGAFRDFFSPPDQQMIVSHMKWPQPIQILVENSADILQIPLCTINGYIDMKLTTENSIPWESFLFAVDQDIILLLYYK